MYQKLGEVVDGPRLTEVWCSVWVASALVLRRTPSPGYSRQLGALLPTYRLAASAREGFSEAPRALILTDDYMSRACLLARASVLFSATSAFLCVFLTFIPRKKLGNLGLQHNALLLC
eukprot:g73325.t1